MKRGRGDTLTGGTKDVNPQQYTINLVQSGNDLTNNIKVPVPVYRFPLKNDRAMVMEILRVQWIIKDIPVVTGIVNIIGAISTNDSGMANAALSVVQQQYEAVSGPNVIDAYSIDGIFATASGFFVYSRIEDHDKTDSAGHGVLVATDFLYLVLASSNSGAALELTAKITYRWKEVSLAEYIGIVQSQQGPN